MGCRVVWLVVAGVAMLPPGVLAQGSQDRPPRDSVALIPGPRYRAGWLRRWLLGDHYRDLWTQSLKLELLDLERFGGGLQPECQAADPQAASLRLRGVNGRQYVFRSTNQGPASALLPPSLRRAPAGGVLQDQVSSRHPAASLVLPPLLAALQVPYVEPALRVMPDHGGLGGFREPFAGMLGTIEEEPAPGFAGADRVERTEQLWTRLDGSPEDQVDAPAYLAARLVDILVGDWDRHFEKWSWAGYEGDGGRLWRPIPQRREQAFARFDGLIPSVARRYLPQLVSFESSYPDMYGLTWSARAMDRRFLVSLEKPVWDSVARAVQARLSDSVLGDAVGQLPPELHRLHGADLRFSLRHRRDQLRDATDAFYGLVVEYADVRATDQDEWAEVDRVNDTVWLRIGKAGGAGVPYFERGFAAGETREIRLYLGGGNDRVVVRGATPRSAVVRVMGGAGNDEMIDSSRVGLPVVRNVLTSTFFYDSEGDNVFVAGSGTEISRSAFRAPPSRAALGGSHGPCGETLESDGPPRDLADPFRDFGSRWVPAPWLSFQPNLGLLIGAGAERYGYAFRKAPYGSRVTLRGAYATLPKRFRVWYEGDFRNLPRGAWGSLAFRYSGIDILQFYGFGNETQVTAPAAFYQVTQRQVAVAASVIGFPPRSRVSVGPFLGYFETELGRGGLVDSLRPYGVDRFVEAGAQARVEVDSRDRALTPRRGVRLIAHGRVVPKGLDATEAYGSLSGEAATYLSAGDPARVTLALRAGGKRVWGRYPYHAAAYLGGATTVRGYNEQRFAGDAVVYGNAEARVFVTRFSIVLPGDLGFLALGDVGRAYLAAERSATWHGALGGGLWLAFIERGSAVSLTVARSPERWAYYGGLGFMF